MSRRPLEPAISDALARTHINSQAYGRVRYTRGYEQYGPHRLPVAVFDGGARVAMYCVPDSSLQRGSAWRPVYTTESEPAFLSTKELHPNEQYHQ